MNLMDNPLLILRCMCQFPAVSLPDVLATSTKPYGVVVEVCLLCVVEVSSIEVVTAPPIIIVPRAVIHNSIHSWGSLFCNKFVIGRLKPCRCALIEITFVVVPIIAPILLTMDIDPIWLGIMIAINLQASFLTPPFGFALFYLRGVAPESIKTQQIYRGVIPFVAIQLLMLIILSIFPALVTWLPNYIYS